MELDILAFGAHPDDVELAAGGTLAKMAALGHATGIVDITRGEMGTRGTPAIRAREAKKSASILGVKVRESLRLPDGFVQVSSANRLKIVRVLRRYRPAVVLVHYWEDNHPDHVNTSRLVTEACHHAGLARIETGQKRFRPDAVLYFKLPFHVAPTIVVDVSDYAEQRLAAIHAYRSQLHDPESREPETYLSDPNFVSRIEGIQSFYGGLIGKPKGEGFFMKRVVEIRDPVSFFRRG
jgi:bacillithiol biosynthesis deacetylase BshB1